MAYKIQITDENKSINFNGRYENLQRAKRPEIIAKAPNGKPVKQVTVFNSTPLPPGSTSRSWMDEDGTEYSKSELNFFIEDTQVEEIEQTKVMQIEGYQPLQNYTDNYVISAFYELFPDDNSMKKDIDRVSSGERRINPL